MESASVLLSPLHLMPVDLWEAAYDRLTREGKTWGLGFVADSM